MSTIEVLEFGFGSFGSTQPYQSWSKDSIKQIQTQLASLGLYSKAIDGIIGAGSIAGLKTAFGKTGSADAWMNMSAADVLFALTGMKYAAPAAATTETPPAASDAWRTPAPAAAETPAATPSLLARLSAAAATAATAASAAIKTASAAGATAGDDAAARAAVAKAEAAAAALAAAKPRKDNTMLYVAIGGGVLALGVIALALRRRSSGVAGLDASTTARPDRRYTVDEARPIGGGTRYSLSTDSEDDPAISVYETETGRVYRYVADSTVTVSRAHRAAALRALRAAEGR